MDSKVLGHIAKIVVFDEKAMLVFLNYYFGATQKNDGVYKTRRYRRFDILL
jgi:hypothetical protein